MCARPTSLEQQRAAPPPAGAPPSAQEVRPQEGARAGRLDTLLLRASAYLARCSPRKVVVLSLLLVLVIGWLDYLTSLEISLLTFYWIPVALSTWYGSARAGYALAVTSVLAALGTDLAGGLVRSHFVYFAWDFFSRMASFVILVWIIAKLKQLYLQSVRTSQLELELRANQAAFKELKALGYLITHNWRAPLRSIDGYAQLLLENYGSQLGPEGQEFLTRLRQSNRFMAKLIDALLQLIEYSGGELRPAQVDLTALAQSIASELQAENPGRPVHCTVQPGLVAWGDARLIRVALKNLLANAWKFTLTQPAAQVSVGARLSAEGPVYFVRDNGAGFDMAHAHMLFKPHHSAHGPNEFEGLGIGLPIAQRIIERHGGRIWAEGARGAGATFHFTLTAPSPNP